MNLQALLQMIGLRLHHLTQFQFPIELTGHHQRKLRYDFLQLEVELPNADLVQLQGWSLLVARLSNQNLSLIHI